MILPLRFTTLVTEFYGASERVPYNTALEEGDQGIFNYRVKLALEEPPTVLENVPEYSWYHGCIPTAVGSIMGYWDQNGYGNLFNAQGWDAVRQTANVQEEISSDAHNTIYDNVDDPGLAPGPSLPSIADFAQTSVGDPPKVLKGWGKNKLIDDAVRDYADYKGYELPRYRQS